jgi:hypothetical protein
MASSMFWKTCGWRWPDTENAHGSPPDWCQISACMIFGSTVRAQAVMSVVRSMVFTLRVDTRGNPGGILGLWRRGRNARDTG